MNGFLTSGQYNYLMKRLGIERVAVPGEAVDKDMVILFDALIDRLDKLESAQCKSVQQGPQTLEF